jgi:hypothetical protein
MVTVLGWVGSEGSKRVDSQRIPLICTLTVLMTVITKDILIPHVIIFTLHCSFKERCQPGLVVHSCSPSTQGAKAAGSEFECTLS